MSTNGASSSAQTSQLGSSSADTVTINLTISNSKNLIESKFKILDEPDSKQYHEFLLDLIRKQVEQELKIKADISALNARVTGQIYDKIERGHTQIYDYKCRDYLSSFGYDKENANQTINYLLESCDNLIELDELKSFFNQYISTSWQFNVKNHLIKLISCTLMPGFIDCFAEDNTVGDYEFLWQKLYKFLLNHRPTSEMINESYLENRITVNNLRRAVLIEIENNYQDEMTKNKSLCVDQQCFSQIKVCCSTEKMNYLIDGKSHTYWQTSNAEKCESHWILINMKENIKLSAISLHTIGSKTDDFLKSVVIELKAGSSANGSNKSETIISKCDYGLTLNSDYVLCNCFPHEPAISYLKLVFKRNNEKNYWGKNSDQIKIKSIKLTGKREASVGAKVTVQDASICWYFEMLSAMALMQSQIIPALHVKIMQISKIALDNMPPLSLAENVKNTFLTPHVLVKVDEFLKNFLQITSSTEKADAILIYLSFNLARCHLKSILNALLLILANPDLAYQFAELMSSIEKSAQISMRKSSRQIKFTSLTLAGNQQTATNQSSIVESMNASTVNYQSIESDKYSNSTVNITPTTATNNEETSEFTLEPANSRLTLRNNSITEIICYNMLLCIESNVTLTSLNLKLKLDSIGIKAAIVILIPSKATPRLEQFSRFDKFNQERFNSYKSSSAAHDPFELCFFDFYDNQLDIYLELPISAQHSRHVIVKLIKSKDLTSGSSDGAGGAKALNIASLKLNGYKHDSFELYDELKRLQSANGKLTSSTLLVNTVLWFLCQLTEQRRSCENSDEDELPRFLDLDGFEVNYLWQVYEKAQESAGSRLNIPVLILLYELVKCDEVKTRIEASSADTPATNAICAYQNIFNSLFAIIDEKAEIDEVVDVNLRHMLKSIAKEILKNGVSIFFPSDKLRKECFLTMIDRNVASHQKKSVTDLAGKQSHHNFPADMRLERESTKLLFEALCSMFAQKKQSLIQHFVKNVNASGLFENEQTDLIEIIRFMDRLIELYFVMCELNEPGSAVIKSLQELLNAMQSFLFYAYKDHLLNNLTASGEAHFDNAQLLVDVGHAGKNATRFLTDYVKLLISKCGKLADMVFFAGGAIRPRAVDHLKLFFKNFIYNFLLWFSELFAHLDVAVADEFVKTLIDFHKMVSLIQVCLNEEKLNEEERPLCAWMFNSKLRSTISDVLIEYNYPLASRFVVEFDPTSNIVFNESTDLVTYSFIDSSEKSHLFSGKLDGSLSRSKMTIQSNSTLLFSIRSSKDLKQTSSFFLKFKVTAYGHDKLTTPVQFSDLSEVLSGGLIAKHLARVYLQRTVELDRLVDAITHKPALLPPQKPTSSSASIKEDYASSPSQTDVPNKSFLFFGYQYQFSVASSMQSLSDSLSADKNRLLTDMNSVFYKVLFRGGFFDEKSTVNSQNSKLLEFLNSLSNYVAQVRSISESDSDYSKFEPTTNCVRNFMRQYDSGFESEQKLLESCRTRIGGLAVTELVVRIFCALIWHNPSLNYERMFDEQEQSVFCESVAKIYKAADSTRKFIVEQQQLFKTEVTKSSKSLLEILNEKAVYLLKFERIPDYLVKYELLTKIKHSQQDHSQQFMRQPDAGAQNSTNPVKKEAQRAAAKKTVTHFPKSDLYESYNLVFDFIFQTNLACLDFVTSIVHMKHISACQINANFSLALTHLENILKQDSVGLTANSKSKIECLLIFLANFFSSSSSLLTILASKNQQNFAPHSSVKALKAKINFPPMLKFNLTHYTEHLYACGLACEQQMKICYFAFVKLILDFSASLKKQQADADSSLSTCLDCYLTSLLDIDWELFDMHFLDESNIVDFLLENACRLMPIKHYNDRAGKTNSRVLEDAFDLSKQTFQAMLNESKTTNSGAGVQAVVSSDQASKNSIYKLVKMFDEDKRERERVEDRENEASNEKAKQETDTCEGTTSFSDVPCSSKVVAVESSNDSSVSFDTQIFPKLYQRVFQANSSTAGTMPQKKSAHKASSTTTVSSFDTDSLLKSIQGDIKTYEQYERFIVARYMLWKYFFKFKINFYCDDCECVLNSVRYVCLECKDHFLCANCFAESIVPATDISNSSNASTAPTAKNEDSGKIENWSPTPKTKAAASSNAFNQNLLVPNGTHMPSHAMLLLDHICNRCDSLIIGQRHKCAECDDYDLCAMCATNSSLVGLLCDEGKTVSQEKKSALHKKEHRLQIHEPVIIVARPEQTSDTQVYAYLHSKMLLNVLTLKIADLSKNCAFFYHDNLVSASVSCLDSLGSKILNQLVCMIIQSCGGLSAENLNRKKSLTLFSLHSQENLIGLLATVINKHKSTFLKNRTISAAQFKLSEISSDFLVDKILTLNQYDLVSVLLTLLSESVGGAQQEHIKIMFINILKTLLSVCEPSGVDPIALELIKRNKYEIVTQLDTFVASAGVHIKKREHTLELFLFWIDNHLVENSNSLSDNLFNIIFKLSHSEPSSSWSTSIASFVSYLLDVLVRLYDKKGYSGDLLTLKSKLVNFFVTLNSVSLAMHCGQWADYRSKSRYDGAGILRSTSDLKVGVIKQFYSEASYNTFYICLHDPQTRKLSYLFGQKFGVDFRKSTLKSKLKFVNSFSLRSEHAFRMVELLKRICARYKLIAENSTDLPINEEMVFPATSTTASSSSTTPLTNRQVLANYESMHVSKKREFSRLFQQVSLNSNVLVVSILTSLKSFISQVCSSENEQEIFDIDSASKLIDYEFLAVLSKLAFQNTNMNSNWCLFFLRYLLRSLIINEGFGRLKQELELEEQQRNETTAETDEISSTTNNTNNSNENLESPSCIVSGRASFFKHSAAKSHFRSSAGVAATSKTTSFHFIESASTVATTTTTATAAQDNLRLNLSSQTVLGVCDDSTAFLFTTDNLSSCAHSASQAITGDNKRDQFGLKLFENSIEKLSNFYANTIKTATTIATTTAEPVACVSSNSDTSSKQLGTAIGVLNAVSAMPAGIRSAIKLVSSAITVLTSRQLVILLINLATKLARRGGAVDLNMRLNCQTEFEFLQLADILFYTESLLKYRLFVKNLTANLLRVAALGDEEENAAVVESKARFWTRIGMMACDFMLPEFKLVKRVAFTWKNDTARTDENGKLKNKTNHTEETSENNLLLDNINLLNATANIGSKPNDIEKLCTNDSLSNLLIVFDAASTRRPKPVAAATSASSNVFSRRAQVKKFIRDNKLIKVVSEATNRSSEDDDDDDDGSVDSLILNKRARKSGGKLLGNRAKATSITKAKNLSDLSDFSDGNEEKEGPVVDENYFTALTLPGGSKKKSSTKHGKKSARKPSASSAGRRCMITFQVVSRRRVDSSIGSTATGTGVSSSGAGLVYDDTNIEIFNLSDANNDDTDNNEEEEDDEDEVSNEENSVEGAADGAGGGGSAESDSEDDADADTDGKAISDEEEPPEGSDVSNYDFETDFSNESDANEADIEYDYDIDNTNYEWVNANTMQTNSNADGAVNNDSERVMQKAKFTFPLEFIEHAQFLSIQNQRMLKWKLVGFKNDSASSSDLNSCSFKIFSTLSKNFESAYYLLDEVIEQLDVASKSTHFALLDELWLNLIRIACAQSFTKRLKVLGLLIKIVNKVSRESLSDRINLNALKPLKNLHYTLETTAKEDRNLSRALYELFFFAEKLAIQWSRQKEFWAHMRDHEELVEKVREASQFIIFLMNAHGLGETSAGDKSVPIQTNVKQAIKAEIEEDPTEDEEEKEGEEDEEEEEMFDAVDNEESDTS